MEKVTWTIPLKTVSEANCSEHWTKKAKRHRQQQFFIRCLFNVDGNVLRPPCEVKMIRVGPRYLDKEENLPCALKWVKDEIADCLQPDKVKTYVDKKGKIRKIKGRTDDNPEITWLYDQEKGKTGIRIEITIY